MDKVVFKVIFWLLNKLLSILILFKYFGVFFKLKLLENVILLIKFFWVKIFNFFDFVLKYCIWNFELFVSFFINFWFILLNLILLIKFILIGYFFLNLLVILFFLIIFML